MPLVSPAAISKDRERLRQLRRAQSDLYYLATKLGYSWRPSEQQGVTEDFHGPMCRRMDLLRDHPLVGTFAQRKGLKSTVFTICLAVQEILRDPDITIMVNHAVEKEAEKMLEEVGGLFQNNAWLRSLDPIGVYPPDYFIEEKRGKQYPIMPLLSKAKNSGYNKFLKAGSFTIRRAGHRPTTKRQPTMVAKGAGSETTGTHVDMILLDDIIGLSTLEESTGMARVRSWWRSTALNVLNALGRVRLVGTRWDEYDFYADLIGNSRWDILVRSARETDGVMDYKGLPTHYGPGTKRAKGGIEGALKREENALKDMGPADYAAQRMNDPSPQSEKAWDKLACEHFIKRQEAAGPGVFFILSDPAPAKHGSFTGVGEAKRSDGTKDDWATCVVKMRARGQRQEIILLDGSFSKHWEPDEGLDVICGYVQRYPGAYTYIEAYGGLQKDYTSDMRKASRRNHVQYRPVEFKGSYAAKAKNLMFAKLAERAKQDEFLICESVPTDFLEMFLEQARNWRSLPKGRNNLRYDDVANVVSMATQQNIAEFSPKAEFLPEFIEDEDNEPQRSRYCGW